VVPVEERRWHIEPLRLALPAVGDEELVEVARVLKSGYLTQGAAVARFEELVAAYVGVRHALAMSSATTALHLSLVAFDVSKGDDVVVPAFTFPATANVVVQTGARPVLADIDLQTFAVTEETVAEAITPATTAVMPVDPFGYPAPMEEITALADREGLRVVEDAACAIGATRHGRPCGSFRDVGCFSFHPRKVITTGEGGMITTDDDELADRIGVLRSHGGRRVDGRFRYEAAGFNYRLSDVHGALGIAQMAKIERLLARRRELAMMMNAALSGLPGVTAPAEHAGASPTYQSYVVLLGAEHDRDGVIHRLRQRGVESTLGTYGLHLEPYYRDRFGLTPDMFPKATVAARQSLALPLFPGMSDGDVERVAEAMAHALGSA
jgi:perosamine synthetase